MGHTYMHRVHMEHIHTQFVLKISSSIPRAAILKNFLGSMPSKPVAGHPEAHAPQVRHAFRFPPSGKSFITLSLKTLVLAPPILIAVSPMLFFLLTLYHYLKYFFLS